MNMKSIVYCGTSAKDIGNFESRARQRALRLLDMLRFGLALHPNDFKYMRAVGDGVYELRVKVGKQYRIFYVTKFEEAIYVLHAFVKKTQKTSQHDIEVGKQRYKAAISYLRGKKK